MIRHKRQVTEEESQEPGYVISWEEWNEGHIIELGSARIFTGPDNSKTLVTAERGNLYMATDTGELYYYEEGWNSAFTDLVRSSPPTGKKKILNFWWDDETGEIVIQTED